MPTNIKEITTNETVRKTLREYAKTHSAKQMKKDCQNQSFTATEVLEAYRLIFPKREAMGLIPSVDKSRNHINWLLCEIHHDIVIL